MAANPTAIAINSTLKAMGEVDFKDLPHRPRVVTKTAAMVAANAAHLAGRLKAKPYPG